MFGNCMNIFKENMQISLGSQQRSHNNGELIMWICTYFINAFYDQFCEIPMKLWHCAKVAFACAAIDALCGFCPCPCGPRCRDCVYVNVIDSAADHLSDFNITARWIPMRKNNVWCSGDAAGVSGGGGGGDRTGVSCQYICKLLSLHCDMLSGLTYSWDEINHKLEKP